jgi:hypothetical protein
MSGLSASTSSWGGSGSRGCFLLGEDMARESGAEDRSEVERTEGEGRCGGAWGRSSSDEGGEESGEEVRLMVSTAGAVAAEGGGEERDGRCRRRSRWRNNPW